MARGAGVFVPQAIALLFQDALDLRDEHARFVKHLQNHLGEWFTFLRHSNVGTANFRAEQAIRLAVVNRKVWGGNRTWPGAHAQTVLSSVLVTCGQLLRFPIRFLTEVLTATQPAMLILPSR